MDDNKIYFSLHLYANTPNIYINNTIQSINFNNINISEISNEKVEIIKEKMVKYQEKQEIPESEIIINNPTLIFKNSNQVQPNFIFNCENSNENENFKKIDGLLGDLNLFLEKLDEKESELLKYSEENISKLIKKTRDTFNYDCAKFENNPDEYPKEINCLLERFKKFKIRTEQSLKLYKANYVKYQESEISYPKEKNKFIIPNLSNIQIIRNDIKFNLENNKNMVDLFAYVSREGKIEFNSGKFSKIIGPIIPELYKGQAYCFQIFSFIDKNINLKLCQISNNKSLYLLNYFSVPSFTESYKPILIKFEVPDIYVNEATEETISFYLTVSIEGNTDDKYTILYEFIIQFLPLNIYISYSDGSLNYEEREKIFKLNIGNIVENSNIDLKIEIPTFEKIQFLNVHIMLKV